MRDAQPENAHVAWALRRIEERAETQQHHTVGQLARELGYSPKHVIALFRDQVGVSPKLCMRLVRFERLRRAIRAAPASSLAELASACGYCDQSHLAREVRQFTGDSASHLLAEHGSDARR
jgi:AraC-like DNA-binding protein